jgi:hypothetical protein
MLTNTLKKTLKWFVNDCVEHWFNFTVASVFIRLAGPARIQPFICTWLLLHVCSLQASTNRNRSLLLTLIAADYSECTCQFFYLYSSIHSSKVSFLFNSSRLLLTFIAAIHSLHLYSLISARGHSIMPSRVTFKTLTLILPLLTIGPY